MTGFTRAQPVCPYCGAFAELVNGDRIYGPNRGFEKKLFYQCQPCAAYVGCHAGTTIALGRLANAELRRAKCDAHAAFDPLWRRKIEVEKCSKSHARRAGYRWLAKQLGIDAKDCHIGQFDVELCKRVVAVCSAIRSAPRPYSGASNPADQRGAPAAAGTPNS